MSSNQYIKAAAEIRKLTISSMASAGFGHIGGSMSICEALAVLYEGILNIDPLDPQKKDRDWLVLSKGHCGPALYAALAYKGYFDRELLKTLNQNGTSLPSHCDRLKTCGIDLSTGSLGQGVSLGIGAALGNRMRGIQNHVYIIVGDGELQEGQVWEGIQFAAHWKLDNLVLIVDNNKRQLDGWTQNISSTIDLPAKFEAFNFEVLSANGQDCDEIFETLSKAKQAKKPVAVILNTQKGQGCSFAEKVDFNHYMVITEAMAEEAIVEIDSRLEEELNT
jgi:transketolase